MMPATAVDNLLAFGYMVPGVTNVSLEIDQEKRIAKYDVKVSAKVYRRYLWVNKLSKGGIFKKILALILIHNLNAPKPNIFHDFILKNASAYLPNYTVEVNVGR